MRGRRLRLITPIQYTNQQPFNRFHFLRFTGSYKKSQAGKRFIADDRLALSAPKEAISLQKKQETSSCDTLISIYKSVVLDHQIQQHSGLFLNAGINVIPTDILTNLVDGTVKAEARR